MDEDLRAESKSSASTLTFAFVAGALIGAGAVLLLTPEPGAAIRKRLMRGAKTAQEELVDAAAETRDALEALSKDARQTLKQSATRFNAALGATKDALTGGEAGIGKRPA